MCVCVYEMNRRCCSCFLSLRLESSVAIVAHTFAHGQTAQNSDGKEEYGQEDCTTAVLFAQHTHSTIRTIAAHDNYLRLWLHNHLWLLCVFKINKLNLAPVNKKISRNTNNKKKKTYRPGTGSGSSCRSGRSDSADLDSNPVAVVVHCFGQAAAPLGYTTVAFYLNSFFNQFISISLLVNKLFSSVIIYLCLKKEQKIKILIQHRQIKFKKKKRKRKKHKDKEN